MEAKTQISRIFSYLRDIKKIDQKIIRNINDYQKLIWLADFLDADGCSIYVDNDFSDDWLVVKKQIIEPPPKLPDSIQNLIDKSFDIKNPEQPPKCPDAVISNTQLKAEWDSWLIKWNDWGSRIGKKFKTQKLYNELFEIYQILKKEIGVLDFIIGHGVLSWNKGGFQILHPALITKMQLIFDAKNGIFHLKPATGQTVLEFDMLDNLDIPNREQIEELKHRIAEDVIDPRKFEAILPYIKEIANFIDRDGRVNEVLASNQTIQFKGYPVLYNAPVIILRKQDVRLWINEINNIIKAIEAGYPIPKTIETITSDESIPQDSDTRQSWQAIGEELLFTMPANEEQKEIARRLAQNYGVVVQGPPGTGKSHTIVNLVCHLLANGKKVLVTSETERALRVLNDKIPDEIRPLCLNVLGSDIASIKELEFSINKITENLERDPRRLEREISASTSDLDNVRRKQADLKTELRDISQLDTQFVIEYENKKYKLDEISRYLFANANRSFVIPDKIGLSDKYPLNQDEFNRLLVLFDKEPRIQEILRYDSVMSEISSRNEISSSIMKLLEYGNALQEQQNNITSNGWLLSEENILNFELGKALIVIDQAFEEILKCDEEWSQQLLVNCMRNPKLSILISQMKEQADKWWSSFITLHEKTRFTKYTIPLSINDDVAFEKLYRDFQPLYERFKESGNLGFMTKISCRDSLYIIDECFVDAKKIDTLEKAEKFRDYLELVTHRKQLESLWSSFCKEFGASPVNLTNLEDIAKFTKYLQNLSLIINWDKDYYQEIIFVLDDFITPGSFDFSRREGLIAVKRDILTIQLLLNYLTMKKRIDAFNALILSNAEFFKIFYKEFDVESIKNGIQNLSLQQMSAYLDFIYYCIDKITESKKELTELQHLKEILGTVCPQFIQQLENEPKMGQLLTKYPNWTVTWQWNIFDKIYFETHERSFESIEEELQQLKGKEQRIIGELVAKKTWYERILQTKDSQKRSLHAWLTAVRKIGKGTGKYAPVHRRTAQKELENCKGAIPVWIMPLHRVIENIKLSDDLFDAIIFDESSQSDIFALSALFRAKKAVIVGDDKQISPYAIGTDTVKILELNRMYLKEIPHSELFDLKTSLYDFGRIIFTSNLMLREHFRCVPEIIQFSNDFCYGGSIIPLRYPKREEIFEPAVVSVRVKNGYRDEMVDVNNPEAEALVTEVVRCCEDKKYRGMSIGIISLLGERQANLIQSLLREKLGEEEFVNRRIVCGDAYAFQGDERDLMFLSLVIATNVRFTALTKEDDVRRFNVAASRARNRMWLFHSVDLQDLNSNCVRYKLLSYCLNPGRVKREFEKVEKLFESTFEKDVFKLIESQGYAVTPQVKVGQYRIDLVVEGIRNRLAVECDGDSWHGVEKWEEDLERQQQLERVGWIFSRIRASEFYRDPHRAIQPTLKKIEELGIEKGLNLRSSTN